MLLESEGWETGVVLGLVALGALYLRRWHILAAASPRRR